MNSWADLCRRGLRSLVATIFTLVLWTAWLALAAGLAFQIYILSVREIAAPEFILRALEARIEAHGFRASVGKTSFDPAGHLLFEDLRFSPLSFDEPVVTARSLYLRLNPWWLAVGQVVPRDIRIHDVTAAVPAILSPTGQTVEVLSGLDAAVEVTRRSIRFRELSARVAGVTVTAHGHLMIPPRTEQETTQPTLPQLITRHFADACRQALAVKAFVAQFEEPRLELTFAPSESGAATIDVLALARQVRLAGGVPVAATAVRATTRLLLFGDSPPSDLVVSATEVRLPGEIVVQGMHARLLGRLRLDGQQFDPRELFLTADRVVAAGIEAGGVSATAIPRGLPRFAANATARLLGEPLNISVEGNAEVRLGVLRFAGAISPRVLDVVSRHVGTNVRRFYAFDALVADRGEVRFGPDLKFESLSARVRIPRMNSYGVIMEDGVAAVELTPTRFHSPEAFARVGDNFARGTYDHDLRTHDYRFLLEGRLRPLEISRWFREWWSGFFNQLAFSVAPPDATVDVRGSWRDPRQTSVFVFADASRPVLRGTEFERVRTRIFTRPGFFDGLELLAARDQGNARGRFTFVTDPVTNEWQTFDLSVASTLDLPLITQLLGKVGADTLAPFRLAAAPLLRVEGQFAGPAAPGGPRTTLRIDARTTGEFRFHDFPLQDVAFVAKLERDEVTLENVGGRFAGGVFAGQARAWGVGDQRRLGFDLTLDDASLGQVAAEVGGYLAAREGRTDTTSEKFVQAKANVRLKLGASAEGGYTDARSYRGSGSATLVGPGLGEISLLGGLSELLKFTALTFTEARANFRIEGPRIVFPDVTVRGASARVEAHGSYGLDTSLLDFNAKLFPFQESENLLKSVVGAVLTPLSNAFEVKLVGPAAKPEWSFVIGPTSFIRALTPGSDPAVPSGPGAPEPAQPSSPADASPPSASPTSTPR
jgi:hypothetical protein